MLELLYQIWTAAYVVCSYTTTTLLLCTQMCACVCCVCGRVLISSEFDQQGKFFLPPTFLLYFPTSYFLLLSRDNGNNRSRVVGLQSQLTLCFFFFSFLEGTARNHSITAHADSSCETYVAAPDYENEDRIKSWPSPRSLYGPANNLNRGRCSGEVETAIRFVYMCWGTISRTPASEKEPAAAAAAGKEGNEDEEETISRADTAGLLLPDWNGESLLIALRQKGGWDEERRRRGARVMNYCPTIYLQPGGCDWINNQRAVCIFHATISAGPSISSLCNQSGDMLGNGERRREAGAPHHILNDGSSLGWRETFLLPESSFSASSPPVSFTTPLMLKALSLTLASMLLLVSMFSYIGRWNGSCAAARRRRPNKSTWWDSRGGRGA